MPALYLFNRRTILGGDDLQPAAFITVSLRCFQLILLLGPIFHHIAQDARNVGGLLHYMLYDPVDVDDEPSCRHSHYFAMLFVGHAISSGIYSLMTIALEWKIAHHSSQGSPTEVEPRSQRVSTLLEYKLLPFSILLFLIWSAGLSAVSFGPLYYRCTAEGVNLSSVADYSDDLVYLGDQEEPTKSLWKSLWWIAFGILLLTQFMEILFSWVYLMHLCRQPKRSALIETNDWDEQGFHPHNHELVEQMWVERCSSACQCMSVASCFMFGGRELAGQAEFGDVARALADYLETRGVLDVAPSDIVAGMAVLQLLQRQRLTQARKAVLEQGRQSIDSAEAGVQNLSFDTPPAATPLSDHEGQIGDRSGLLTAQMSRDSCYVHDPFLSDDTSSVFRIETDGRYQHQVRSLLSRHNLGDLQSLEEGARYARYALAIYTWVLYVYEHPITGPARVLVQGGCNCLQDKRGSPMVSDFGSPEQFLVDEHGRIEGDNMCHAHKTALLLAAGLEEADLVYAQLRSGFKENPYCILLDHEWKSVVVSIRGTFSLEDCVTDVLIKPEPLDQFGEEFGFDGRDQYCHGGVMLCVRNVYRDLERHGLLDKLISGEHAMYPGYTLRFVGHSLGAATCTLLSYMLRPRYPTIRCVNYSPPGCSLTWDLATGCKDFCNTFVLDSDLVPRLSLDSMDRLRDETLELLGRIKVSKIEVARIAVDSYGGALYHFLCKKNLPGEAHLLRDMSELLHHPDDVPDSLYQEQLARYKEIQHARREARGTSRSVKLYPPGKMIHLTKTGEKRSCMHGIAKCMTCCTTSFGSEYHPVWIDNADLNEIVVVPTMGTDHFPNRMRSVLEAVAKEFACERNH